jgi:diketogulonate reductase-like aldo/keto reductase
MPYLDPLDQLVDSTQSENDKEEMKKRLGKNTDMLNFHAKEKIELRAYLPLLEKRKQRVERNWKIHRALKDLAEKSTATRAVLKVMGFEHPYYNIDKVRTLHNLNISVWCMIY